MSSAKVSINLVVLNGEKYIRQCLDSILNQSYDHNQIEVNTWDNASTDSTKQIIEEYKSKFESASFSLYALHFSLSNLGMWPAQEVLFNRYSVGRYTIVVSVDIIMDPNFIKNAVEVMENDTKIGALQAKIYQYSLDQLKTGSCPPTEASAKEGKLETKTIDTCGFKIFKSRRLINIGHGEKERGQFNQEGEIFAVEGAVPVFRREALEGSKIDGHFIDPDFFWYGDDIDLTWRMQMLGWKQWYSPKVIAYHDRQTTKKFAGSRKGFVSMRRELPMFKRRLDWRNWMLTVIKNDYLSNYLRDLPSIIWRWGQLWMYFIVFEPSMILEIPKVVRLLPRMLKRRRAIMRRARVSPSEVHQWFS